MTEITDLLKSTSSYEAATIKFDLGPLRDKLNLINNDYHEARRSGDIETMNSLDEIGPKTLDEFERTESRKSHNPPWRRRVMRAGWHNARGEYELALEYEMEGWKYSLEPSSEILSDTASRMQSISASNIADELLRLGRTEDAVPWAKKSVELWRTNPVNFLVLGIVLYMSGRHDDAELIFKELQPIARFRDRKNALAACISYEDELRVIDSPTVKDLLQEAHSSNV